MLHDVLCSGDISFHFRLGNFVFLPHVGCVGDLCLDVFDLFFEEFFNDRAFGMGELLQEVFLLFLEFDYGFSAFTGQFQRFVLFPVPFVHGHGFKELGDFGLELESAGECLDGIVKLLSGYAKELVSTTAMIAGVGFPPSTA